jgi:hypothetical protein
MRTPATVLTLLNRQQMRHMLVRSVARGNEYGFESPFVHVTASFDVARRILAERGHLYTGKIVQISLANFHPDHVINLSDARSQRPWLTDENEDDAEMEDYVARSRTYSAKDKELLLLALPRLADIWLLDDAGAMIECAKDYCVTRKQIFILIFFYGCIFEHMY